MELFDSQVVRQEDLSACAKKEIGGPWKVLDHYQVIQLWKPDFNPYNTQTETIAAWIRLPGLAIEYYNHMILEKIGNIVGRTLKVDTNTSQIFRGKFARICTEVDLQKPLSGHEKKDRPKVKKTMTNQGSIVEKVRAEEITREENVINDDNSISEKERGTSSGVPAKGKEQRIVETIAPPSRFVALQMDEGNEGKRQQWSLEQGQPH
ncbi:hypothetical protein AHAS_Ahas06G0000300 [Arachis hypogaea]